MNQQETAYYQVYLKYNDQTERIYKILKNPYEPGYYIAVDNKPAGHQNFKNEQIYYSNSNHYYNFYYLTNAVNYINGIINHDLKHLLYIETSIKEEVYI